MGGVGRATAPNNGPGKDAHGGKEWVWTKPQDSQTRDKNAEGEGQSWTPGGQCAHGHTEMGRWAAVWSSWTAK